MELNAGGGSNAPEKRVLIYATTAYMIDQFNMMNIRMLQEMGYTVDAACNFESGNPVSEERLKSFRQELDEIGVRQYQLPLTRNIFDIVHNGKALTRSVRIMKERGYDFVHCHTPVGSVIARLACRITHTKVIYTAHGFHFFDGAPWLNWAVYYPVEKLFSYITDVLITINREDYERARRKFHMKRLEYLPGIGVDTDRYRPAVCRATNAAVPGRESSDESISNESDDNRSLNDIRSLRSESGADDSTMLLLSVGELSRRKNHMAVLRALRQIIRDTSDIHGSITENAAGDNDDSEHDKGADHHNAPQFRYIIAGTGVLKDELQKYIDENELSGRVSLLGYRTDVDRLYRAADAFVFPSLQEGLPAALMQAMASGLPAAVSRIRGNADLIDEKGGFLFDVSDPSSVENSIRALLEASGETRHEMGMHNRAVIQEGFSLEAVTRKTFEIYTELA